MSTSDKGMSGDDEGDSLELRGMSAGPSGTCSSSFDEGRGGQMPEKSMIMRRREANRLAAQRLRVRKKGYQDSLEERVRQLEEERAALVHRLEQVEPPAPRGHATWTPPSHEHGARRGSSSAGSSTVWVNGQVASGHRPPGNSDMDLRVASLEAANRRLQDELKLVHEEKERLQAKVDQWAQWERSLPSKSHSPQPLSSRFSEPQSPHPNASPLSMPFLSPSVPSSHFTSPGLPPISKLTPPSHKSPKRSPQPYPPPHPRPSLPPRKSHTVDSMPHRLPGIQLPPLRLPPMPPTRNQHHSGSIGPSSDPAFHHSFPHSRTSSGQPISTSPTSHGRTYPPWPHHPQDPRW